MLLRFFFYEELRNADKFRLQCIKLQPKFNVLWYVILINLNRHFGNLWPSLLYDKCFFSLTRMQAFYTDARIINTILLMTPESCCLQGKKLYKTSCANNLQCCKSESHCHYNPHEFRTPPRVLVIIFLLSSFLCMQCCGTVMIYYGSGSYFGKVWFRFQFPIQTYLVQYSTTKNVYKILPFQC
jgi:hypothetical protein